MSSARNHAKRSHRSHHNMRTNTNYSSRKAIIRDYTKPQKKQTLLSRLLSRMLFKKGETSYES